MSTTSRTRREEADAGSAPLVEVWVVAPGVVDIGPLLGILDEAERGRVATLPADQAGRFVVARALLRGVVGARLGCPAGEVALRARCPVCGGPHGQIVVVPHDVGFSAPHVSLTRAGPLIAVAVSDAGRVGVDVESWSAVAAARLADVALSPAERVAHRRRSSDERAMALARTWVRKEAALKAFGTGLRMDPDRLDTRRSTARLPGCGPTGSALDGARCWVRFADLSLGRGIGGAVALLRTPRDRWWPGPGAGGRRRFSVVVHDGAAVVATLAPPPGLRP